MNIIVARGAEEFRAASGLFRHSDVLNVDTETTGLSFLDNKLLSIQIPDGKNAAVTFPDGEVWPEMQELFETKRLVMHNATFDLKFLQQHGYRLIGTSDVWCTKLGEQLLKAGLLDKASLEDVARRRLGVQMDKSVRKSFIGVDWQDFTEEQIQYAAEDVSFLHKIMRQQEAELEALDMTDVANLEQELQHVVAGMEMRGVYLEAYPAVLFGQRMAVRRDELRVQVNAQLDVFYQKVARREYAELMKQWQPWAAEWERLKAEGSQITAWRDEEIKLVKAALPGKQNKSERDIAIADTCSEYVSKKEDWKRRKAEHKQNQPFREKPAEPETFNPGSHQQLLKALNEAGVRIDNTQSATLEEVAEENEVVELLLEFRKFEKLAQFGELHTYINPKTGRIHPDFNQLVSTGRMSCRQPNLQQVPARSAEGKELRSLFKAPPYMSEFTYSEPPMTGRFALDRPNIEEVERGEVRVIPGETTEHTVLITADYTAIELVFLGAFSGDENLIRANNLAAEGGDPHSFTMSLWLGCAYDDLMAVRKRQATKEQKLSVARARQGFEARLSISELAKIPMSNDGLVQWIEKLRGYVKTLTYGTAYGISSKGLARKFHCEVDEAQALIDAFYTAYPDAGRYLQDSQDFGWENLYSVTPMGRRRFYTKPIQPTEATIRNYMMRAISEEGLNYRDLSDEELRERFRNTREELKGNFKRAMGAIRRQASNAPIQGGSADATKLAMVWFEREIREAGFDSRYGLVLSVHDELVALAPFERAEEMADILGDCMTRAGQAISCREDVHIAVHPKTGYEWGH